MNKTTRERKRTIFLDREELIRTLENLYVTGGDDEEIEIKGIFLTLKTHFKNFELKKNTKRTQNR